MGVQENKRSAKAAYTAFNEGDPDRAMRDMDEAIEWKASGDNSLTGTYRGKQAVSDLWSKYRGSDYRSKPHEFIAEGDKVVVLTTVHLGGEVQENVDLMTFNPQGKLVAFETFADAAVVNRVFAN